MPHSPWLGDVRGGVVTAVIAIPLCVGFGLFAFEPMGERYAAIGVLAGLYAFIFPPAIAYLLGARGIALFGPRNMGAFVVHAMFAVVAASSFEARGNSVVVLLAAVLATAALIQIALSALALGDLAKYIPHPIIAGFQNGAALLLLISQLDSFAGYAHGKMQPLTLAVGLTTVAVMLTAHHMTRRIPAMVVGLAVGCLLYYAFWAAGLQAQLGNIVGEWHLAMPNTHLLLEAHDLFDGRDGLRNALLVLAWGGTLALVASLDALLCLKVIEGFSRQRIDGNRTLMRLGMGNFLAAGLGSLFTSVSLVNSHAAHASGGRTRVAGITAIIVVLLVSFLAPSIIALLPRVVVASLLMVTAIRLFDRWTLSLAAAVATGDRARRRSYLLDLLIIVLVVALTITNQLITAVAVGLALAVASFIFRMSRSIVRRAYRCDVARSRKTRDNQENDILASRGREIAVFELEGALFFGTADRVVRDVEAAFADGARCAVIDVRRVNDFDTTAARLLMQMHDSDAPRGLRMALAGVRPGSRIDNFVRDCGLAAAFGRERIFPDLDDALEWAEDSVIAEARHAGRDDELPLEAFDLMNGLGGEDIARVRALVRRLEFEAGDVVFQEGELGDDMYLIARGTASVKLRQAEGGAPTRLVTFAPGTVFGEVALLDKGPRSATVEADSAMVCYVLGGAQFERLTREHPRIAVQLLRNLAGELGNRLRRANRIIFQLEH
ncbi:MAG TPA: SulP family inorganic anion transporter [Burkholderiales bacterium]|nr:SulP family inorganic anion transporter [Burkholderiales bacterium]